MRSRAPLAALVLLCAAGCLVGPNYRRPEVVTPPSFGELAPTAPTAGRSDAVEGGTPTAWWTTFDDQLLTSLIQRTARANLTLQQAEARVREARASRRIAAAELWPQAEATGSYTRERTSKNGLSVGGAGKVFNLFQAGFDANWEVDVFGGNRRAVEAADASVEAAEDDRNAFLVSLMGEVGLEYVTYRSLQQRIALANQNLAAQQGTLDLTRRLFSAGLAPELDVQRAAAQVATTASTIPLLVQQAAQAMHALSVLIAEPPMTLREELAAVGPIPKPPAQVAVGLPSELLLRRPDVARSERQLAAQTAEIGVATRDLFPRFFITGAASLQSVRSSDFFDWQSRLLSIAPSVSWQIFSGGRIRGNIALQTATQHEFLAAYEAAVLQAFQDVEDALVAFSHEQATRAQLEDAVRANERAADLARQAYAQGLTDFLTVLVAEQSVFTSQDTLAQTQRDVALQLVALYKAVGGGWEAAPPMREASASGS
ncbi:MAG: efflux transporter outer membrane subunit [Deltaproteobacteria bacterium]|nr:MAG: efflux transporter outer membrane subunit [Deltaproteobacteria bacterium]